MDEDQKPHLEPIAVIDRSAALLEALEAIDAGRLSPELAARHRRVLEQHRRTHRQIAAITDQAAEKP